MTSGNPIGRGYFTTHHHFNTATDGVRFAYPILQRSNVLLSGRRGGANEPRNVAIYLCRRLSGQTLKTIGKEFGLANYGSVRSVVSRTRKTLKSNGRLRRRVHRLDKQLIKI